MTWSALVLSVIPAASSGSTPITWFAITPMQTQQKKKDLLLVN